MFCRNCGKDIGNSKYCPKCGKTSGSSNNSKYTNKPRPLWLRILIWIFLLLILPIFLVGLALSTSLPLEDRYSLANFIPQAYYSFIILSAIMSYLLRKFSNIKALLTLLFLLLLALWVLWIYYSVNQLFYQRAERALPQIQSYLVEAAAAKLTGDAIMAGHPIKGTSFDTVANNAEAAAKGLQTLYSSGYNNKTDNYNKAALNWSNQIADAAKNTSKWKSLPAEPTDFKLELSDSKAQAWLKTSLQNIQTLKEFGDTAIKNKDKQAMLYIAAKLLVQKYWLNGIVHSQKANPLSFKMVGEVSAGTLLSQNTNNPFCVCNPEDYDLDTQKCIPKDPRCYSTKQTPTQPATKKPVQQAPQAPKVQQNQPTKPAEPEVPETPTPTPYNYSPKTRDVCLGRTNGSYCAEAAIQSVNEIEASAVGFVEDKPNAQKEWETAWHDLEAMGEVAPAEETTKATPEHSPRVQAFYDTCNAKGSSVGGANQNKGRLPTTESGYHCNYKQGVNNCWDFLTYSGGRFMGGDVGCKELNLVPIAPARH